MAQGRKPATQGYKQNRANILYNSVFKWVESGDTIEQACDRVKICRQVLYKFLTPIQKASLMAEKKRWSSAQMRVSYVN